MDDVSHEGDAFRATLKYHRTHVCGVHSNSSHINLNEEKGSVLNFNHISNELSDEIKEKFISLYKTYQRLSKCYKILYVRKKNKLIALRVLSKATVTIGVFVGGVTLNPIVLGTISGIGVVSTSYIEKSNLEKDIEKCKLAYTSYENVLTELRNYLRGVHFDESEFLSRITQLDDMITDLCPPVDNVEKKYYCKYCG